MLRYISVITCSFGFAIAAQANMITNGSFELPPITMGTYQHVTPASWTWIGLQSDVTIVNNAPGVWPLPEDGQQYVAISNPNQASSLNQNFTVTTGGLYEFTWYNNTGSGNPLPSPYTIDVLNSTSTLVGHGLFDANTGGNWVSHTLLLNLTPDTYTLSFAPLSTFRDPLLDNINVTISTVNVPEPATFTLISLGLAGMAFGKRRKLT